MNFKERKKEGDGASQVELVVNNLPAMQEWRDTRVLSLGPGSGRSPAGGHGNPLQYSCLENPMDRGTWRATVHGIAEESDTTKHRDTQRRPSAANK